MARQLARKTTTKTSTSVVKIKVGDIKKVYYL